METTNKLSLQSRMIKVSKVSRDELTAPEVVSGLNSAIKYLSSGEECSSFDNGHVMVNTNYIPPKRRMLTICIRADIIQGVKFNDVIIDALKLYIEKMSSGEIGNLDSDNIVSDNFDITTVAS